MSENISTDRRSGIRRSSIPARAGWFHALALGGVALAALGCGADNASVLVGAWSYHDEYNGLEFRQVFSEDGTYTSTTRDASGTETLQASGTFSATEDTLVLEGVSHYYDPPRQIRSEFTYYVNESFYVEGAMLPDGAHDGLVGTWTGWLRIDILDGDEVTERLGYSDTVEIRSDGTVTWTSVLDDETTTYSGWYEELADGFSYVLVLEYGDEPGQFMERPFWSLDGRALSFRSYGSVDE